MGKIRIKNKFYILWRIIIKIKWFFSSIVLCEKRWNHIKFYVIYNNHKLSRNLIYFRISFKYTSIQYICTLFGYEVWKKINRCRENINSITLSFCLLFYLFKYILLNCGYVCFTETTFYTFNIWDITNINQH